MIIRLLRKSAAVAAALFLCACSASNSSAGERTLRIGIVVSPNSLSPIFASNTTENMLDRLVFDTLTSIDENGKPVPILAAAVPTLENRDISRDGTRIRFRLRRNVRWQDGVPFTSKDVAFTYRAVMNPHNDVGTRGAFMIVRRVETPDSHTVVFVLKKPFSPAVHALFGESDQPVAIVPEHLLGTETDLNRSAFNAKPVGTGAFRLRDWQRGDRIVFEANPTYFRGKPKLDRIIARIIPDENTAISALAAHEIDWFFEPSPRAYGQLAHDPSLRTKLVNTNQYAALQMQTESPRLRDRRVRRAIAYAIDKKALVERFTNGSAVVADQDLPPWHWASPGRTAHPPDLAAARQLLRTAGYVAGSDGMLVRDGARLALTLVFAQGQSTNAAIAVDLQARLRQIGIDVAIAPYQAAKLFAPASMGGILMRGKYDLDLSGWVSGFDPDNSMQFRCAARPPDGSNITRLCNSEMESAQELALRTYDLATRKRAYATIERVLEQEVPAVYLYYPRGIQSYTPAFSGFAPNSVTESWNAFQWTISSQATRR